ncbi:MAG: type II secretion system F family protein [Halioglobus sp.]
MTLQLAYLFAFIAAASLIGFLGLSILDAVKVREKIWIRAQYNNASKVDAVSLFIRLSMLEAFRSFLSIQRLLATSEKNLVKAGDPTEPEEFVGDLMWQGVIGGLIVAVFIGLVISPLPGIIFGVASGAMWTLWIRPSLLDADATKRTRGIYRRIPYALDISVLVLETGGTLREGLEEIARHDDPLAQELQIALLEMDSGATQATALHNMGERTGLEPLETILGAINRGDETGSPMVDTLITQAEMFRERRLAEIEKLAVEAPTKMTFPNMMIMMSVLIIIIGPLLIQLASSGFF